MFHLVDLLMNHFLFRNYYILFLPKNCLGTFEFFKMVFKLFVKRLFVRLRSKYSLNKPFDVRNKELHISVPSTI